MYIYACDSIIKLIYLTKKVNSLE